MVCTGHGGFIIIPHVDTNTPLNFFLVHDDQDVMEEHEEVKLLGLVESALHLLTGMTKNRYLLSLSSRLGG